LPIAIAYNPALLPADLTAPTPPGILPATMRTVVADKPDSLEIPESSDAPSPPLVPRHRRLSVVLLACVLGGLAWLVVPLLLWAYDIECAGSWIDAGISWPDPRHADSLPQAYDRQALEQALPYLAAAIARRPADAHAYRLSGQVYAALGDWDHAAAAYEQAMALAPANPLPRWDASLIYRQMQQRVKRSPQTPLTDTFAAATLLAPGELVKSLFCNAGGAETCYSGRAVYRQPYAAYPDQAKRTLSVVFLHPPASLAQHISIPPDQAGLHFLVGLDPVARGWATDGAVFRVWVELVNGQRQLAAELPLDRATAQRGWVPGWADLRPWAGQTIMLILESDAGPQGDRTDDWYGWGDLTLMPADAARYAALLPQLRAAKLEREVP